MDRLNRAGAIAAFATLALSAGSALAQAPAQAPVVAPAAAMPVGPAAPPRAPGYLDAADVPDTFHVLPPAPQAGSPARAEDIAAFRETRALKGQPRWALAQADAVESKIMDDMTCATGVALTPQNAPHLYRLQSRLGRDASAIANTAKKQFNQQRPFMALGNKDAICTEDDREEIGKSLSYPSGHATWGWAVGLILAETMPDKAQPILARARAFGESRVVCGVHWVSDITEGRTNASVLVAVLHAKPAFQADLAEAKLEIAAARAAQGATPAGEPGRCALEAAASAATPWKR